MGRLEGALPLCFKEEALPVPFAECSFHSYSFAFMSPPESSDSEYVEALTAGQRGLAGLIVTTS